MAGITSPRFVGQSDYLVALEGLDDPLFEGAEEKIAKIASKAINRITRDYRTQAKRAILEQVAFRPSYLDPAGGDNLRVVRFATPGRLESAIRGRFEPTSLARFVRGSRRVRKAGVSVEVEPGQRKKMNRAFLLNLNSGNLGLAIRLKPGERVRNKTTMVSAYSQKNIAAGRRRASDANLYLLYGPSVNQVFRDVALDLAPDASEALEREFLRLVGVML